VRPLASLGEVTSQQGLNDAMTQASQAFNATAAQLATLPPPTFEGGSELARTVQAGMQSFSQTFIDFSQRVSQIQDGDTAALEQFQQDLQAAAAASPISQMQLTPALTQAVAQIPSCQELSSSS